ncbi:MAG: RNA 2'-phosphotransferase [Clostridia bacterium]|nr:RNA 2'-phosphotransferase [Clostridia bacterium]
MKNHGNDDAYTRIGRYLCLILRHKPEVIGITLDRHGWADVDALLDGVTRTKAPLTREMLEEIVRTDEKMRYSFSEDGTEIRANQGHSVYVEVEMEERTPPEFLWHGTVGKNAASIEADGLRPGSRLYVHLSEDYETAVKVGGRRRGETLVYRVKSGEMARDGFVFWCAANGVWQSKYVPAAYLERK